MKAGTKNNVLERLKKEQLKRRTFTLDFKDELVRHKKVKNLRWADCGRKFAVLPKLLHAVFRPHFPMLISLYLPTSNRAPSRAA